MFVVLLVRDAGWLPSRRSCRGRIGCSGRGVSVVTSPHRWRCLWKSVESRVLRLRRHRCRVWTSRARAVREVMCVFWNTLWQDDARGEPESGQQLVVEEPGDGDDPLMPQGEHDQPGRVRDRLGDIGKVAAECRLGVGSGGYEAEPATVTPGRTGPEERRDRRRTVILVRCRRHREPPVVREQGDDAVDVVGGERSGEAPCEVALPGRVGGRTAVTEPWRSSSAMRARCRTPLTAVSVVSSMSATSAVE
jgi:hypothetical protein